MLNLLLDIIDAEDEGVDSGSSIRRIENKWPFRYLIANQWDLDTVIVK